MWNLKLKDLAKRAGIVLATVCLVPLANAEVRVVVDLAKPGSSELMHGILHGITYRKQDDVSRTIELIEALEPGAWRMADFNNNVPGFVVGLAQFPQNLGTEVTWNLQDSFVVKHGFPIQVGEACTAPGNACFASFEALKKAWVLVVEQTVQRLQQYGSVLTYFEIFSEPNWGWEGVSRAQLMDLGDTAYAIIRRIQPDARIIGLSYGYYREKVVQAFLENAARKKQRYSAISWHEFEMPEDVLTNVRHYRQTLQKFPSLCRPKCPELHILEYAGAKQHLYPGWNVGWLYYFEAAGVDVAARACWDVRDSLLSKKWSTCWNSFNGLLSKDNQRPSDIYWLYKAHSDLGDSRFNTTTTDNHVVAIAGRADGSRALTVLLGKYQRPTSSVVLEIRNADSAGQEVNIRIVKIPNNENKPNPADLSELPQTTRRAQVRDGSILQVIPDVADGDAFIITVNQAVN